MRKKIIIHNILTAMACIALSIGMLLTGINKPEKKNYYEFSVFYDSGRVLDTTSGVGKRKHEKVQEAIEQWAKKNHATILLENYDDAGLFYYSDSDYLENLIGDADNNNKNCIYVKSGLQDYTLKFNHMGEIRNFESVQEKEFDVDFFFPLSLASSYEGYYYTDSDAFFELFEDLEALGFYASYSAETGYLSNLANSIRRALGGSFIAIAFAATFISLLISLVAIDVGHYKQSQISYRIFHLFGEEKHGLVIKNLLIRCAVAFLSFVFAFLIILLWRGLDIESVEWMTVMHLLLLLVLYAVLSERNGLRCIKWGDNE